MTEAFVSPEARPGPTNSLADVGLQVGHYQRIGDGWLTGTTVVLAPPPGALAGVDVRGGAPGTRETDLLAPHTLVERVQAVVLTGGSAYGLAAAHGVVDQLADAGIGHPVGHPVGRQLGYVVPIVPAAVIYDLGRGGEFRHKPDEGFGRQAYAAAVPAESTAESAAANHPAIQEGNIGAGTGAVAGGLKGGVGTASVRLPIGVTIAALVVVNAIGSTVDWQTGQLYGARFGMPGEFRVPSLTSEELSAVAAKIAQANQVPPLNTTIGVIATDAPLSPGQCHRLAASAHSGLARAVHPSHLMNDGDAFFALATGDGQLPDVPTMNAMLAAAADTTSRAIARAMLAATQVGGYVAYRDLPSLAK